MDGMWDGPGWHRSSYCTGADATCVEVSMDATNVLVRDSKEAAGPVLRFARDEWLAFVKGVLAGEFS
jgi:hypothetical protein